MRHSPVAPAPAQLQPRAEKSEMPASSPITLQKTTTIGQSKPISHSDRTGLILISILDFLGSPEGKLMGLEFGAEYYLERRYQGCRSARSRKLRYSGPAKVRCVP
jgi:hypothetical protein